MTFTRTRISPVGRTVWYAGTDAEPGSLLAGDLTIAQDENTNGLYGVRVASNILTSLRADDLLPAKHDQFCQDPSITVSCGCRRRAVARQHLDPMSEEDRKILMTVIGVFPVTVSITNQPETTTGIRSVEDRKNITDRVIAAGFRRVPLADDATDTDRRALTDAIGYDPASVRIGNEFIRVFRTAIDRDDLVHRILTSGCRLHPAVAAEHPTLEGATA
jgi:hypothetical protein